MVPCSVGNWPRLPSSAYSRSAPGSSSSVWGRSLFLFTEVSGWSSDTTVAENRSICSPTQHLDLSGSPERPSGVLPTQHFCHHANSFFCFLKRKRKKPFCFFQCRLLRKLTAQSILATLRRLYYLLSRIVLPFLVCELLCCPAYMPTFAKISVPINTCFIYCRLRRLRLQIGESVFSARAVNFP